MSSKHRKLADNPFAHLLNETTEKYSGRCDLRDLVECVKGLNEEAKAVAIIFLQRNSRGYWHNRGRAALCRYFKRNPPSKRDCENWIEAVNSITILPWLALNHIEQNGEF